MSSRKLAPLFVVLTFVILGLRPAAAGPLPWRDDPFSGLSFASATAFDQGPNNNTRVLHNITVGSGKAVPQLLLMAAWFWPFTDPFSMAWSNALDGWFTNDYHGTGVSLLVTLDNFPGRIRFGDVADDTGAAPLQSTQLYMAVPETRNPNDLVPFLDLGSFAAGETKLVDFFYTFHFGDNRAGNPGAEFFANTLSANPLAVAEPSSLAVVIPMVILAVLIQAPLRSNVRSRRQGGLQRVDG